MQYLSPAALRDCHCRDQVFSSSESGDPPAPCKLLLPPSDPIPTIPAWPVLPMLERGSPLEVSLLPISGCDHVCSAVSGSRECLQQHLTPHRSIASENSAVLVAPVQMKIRWSL
ncbi:hypothetical protein H1C71_005598 [Ictidomys tridecemlineatus]|nr:hypothetical protein H1C71_005598 [Ictidomys tridecemlineatus]KAG3278608.1 hypothetical protein H1C71_005598 [Ictidomys tridecemlineatus]